MELTACIEGLKWVRRNIPWDGVTCVSVVTDSLYVTENIPRAPYWKRHGWRNSHGQPVANRDLWDDLLKTRSKASIRVEFVWQAGKRTDIGNRVDKLAKTAAKRGGTGRDTGYKPGAYCRSMVKGGVALPYPANGQVATIRPRSQYRSTKRESVSTCSMKGHRHTHQSTTLSQHQGSHATYIAGTDTECNSMTIPSTRKFGNTKAKLQFRRDLFRGFPSKTRTRVNLSDSELPESTRPLVRCRAPKKSVKPLC
jgi:ribonuclease HI